MFKDLKSTTVLAALVVAMTAHAQVATTLTSAGGSFTIHAGSYTGAATALSGGADFYSNGSPDDFATRDMWAYRLQGEAREYMVRSNNATFGGTSNVFTAQMFKGANGSDTGTHLIQIDVDYTLGALDPTTPILNKCVKITNLTNQSLDVSLFHYMDYDIPAAAGQDVFGSHTYTGGSTGGTSVIQQFDSTLNGAYMETSFSGVGGPLSYQHGPLFGSLFTNGVPNALSSTVFGGIGDLATGWQIDFTLAPGQQSVCPGCYTKIGVVPEPGTLLAVALGLGALAARRRNCR